MKTFFLLLLALVFAFNSFAQQEDEKTKEDKPVRKGLFKKENLFTGGTLNVSFGNRATALGISPFFGYSINKYIDVAFTTGINYISQRDYQYEGDKLRQTIYGPGAFVRLFPVKFLFIQGQYEYNLIRYKYIPPSSFGDPNERLKYDAHSFLVGGGFASGRDEDSKSYYYISILWDVAKATYSPYKDNLQRAVPVIRAGYNIALFQGGGRRKR